MFLLCVSLDSTFICCVCISSFLSFFFFAFSAAMVDPFSGEQCIYALFMVPQTPLFINFFTKNGSHNTIHTFKNYFATVFSVFSFQFQQNKFYPNTPYILVNYFQNSKIFSKNVFKWFSKNQLWGIFVFVKLFCFPKQALQLSYTCAN